MLTTRPFASSKRDAVTRLVKSAWRMPFSTEREREGVRMCVCVNVYVCVCVCV